MVYGDGRGFTARGPLRNGPGILPPPGALPGPRPRRTLPRPLTLSREPLFLIRSSSDIFNTVAIKSVAKLIFFEREMWTVAKKRLSQMGVEIKEKDLHLGFLVLGFPAYFLVDSTWIILLFLISALRGLHCNDQTILINSPLFFPQEKSA